MTPQSAAASRSMLWLSVLRADTPMQLTFMLNGNSWAQPEQRGDGGWLQTIAVPQFQEEVKMLAPSLLPVFGSSSAIAEGRAAVSVETATILQPHSGPSLPPPATAGFPVLARGWSRARSHCRFVLRTTAHPFYTIFANIFGASIIF